MYSVVLLAAVTMGGESADFGRRGGCHGCRGGWGGCYGGYGGCYGGYGGCYGGYGGCYGGCGGCYGGYGGCYGGSGGCYGGYAVGYGGCYGGYASGGCVGYGGYAAAGPVISGGYAQVTPGGTQDTMVGSNQPTSPTRNAVPRAAPATVVVKVPADARLTVDGQATASTASVRTFETPDLPPGKVYAYTFRASFKKDGKPVSVTRRVKVEAGKRFDVDLNKDAVAVASR